MDSKSHDSDETTILINKVESLNKRLDKLEDQLKLNSDNLALNTSASQELKLTVAESNKTFEQVSEGIKNLYDKIRGFEMLSKLGAGLGNINLGSILGGLGGLGTPPPKKP
jgi:hypothetical protein